MTFNFKAYLRLPGLQSIKSCFSKLQLWEIILGKSLKLLTRVHSFIWLSYKNMKNILGIKLIKLFLWSWFIDFYPCDNLSLFILSKIFFRQNNICTYIFYNILQFVIYFTLCYSMYYFRQFFAELQHTQNRSSLVNYEMGVICYNMLQLFIVTILLHYVNK